MDPAGMTPAQQQQQQQQLQQQQHNADQALETELEAFWKRQLHEVSEATDFKNHNLPLARIKKIMKSDEDVRMISAEAPVLFAKACEMFILELTIRAWAQTEEAKRRTLQRSDISAAIQKTEVFDFLIDIVPRDDPKKEDSARPAPGVGENQIPFYSIPASMQYLPQQGTAAAAAGASAGPGGDPGLQVYPQGVGGQPGAPGVYSGGYPAGTMPNAVYNPQQLGMMASQMPGQYMSVRQQMPYGVNYPAGQFPPGEQPDPQGQGQPPPPQ